MHLLAAIAAVAVGLAVLVWSADRFVEGAAALARRLGVPQMLVGMVIIGFGTSAPELTVSALSAWRGSPSIALGNAYGSNVCNIALILGLTAVVAPLAVRRSAVLREAPPLLLATILSWALLRDDVLSRPEALLLLGVFVASLLLSSLLGLREERRESAAAAAPEDDSSPPMGLGRAAAWTLAGLLLLVGSSRALVWGAVELAKELGVSDLVIGLTVVAVGTSLPELASSLAAARRGNDDMAVGNIVGSNLFNTLAVVGLAGAIRPMAAIPPEVHARDLPATLAATLLLCALGFPRRGGRPGVVPRWGGALLLAFYAAYMARVVR